MKIRTLLVDDEPLARERLRRLLSEEPDVEIVAECAEGASAVEQTLFHRPNLLLLDIQMPGMDGFGVLRELAATQAHLPAIVFITAYDEHAVRAFENCALDYLLKPVSRIRLQKTLTRVRELSAHEPATVSQTLRALLSELEGGAATRRRLAVRVGDHTEFVAVEQIDWVEAAGNYVILHVGPKTHIQRDTMAAMEASLPARAFLRVSRSAIVNLRKVKELRSISATQNTAILHDGQSIAVTRSLREVEERMCVA